MAINDTYTLNDTTMSDPSPVLKPSIFIITAVTFIATLILVHNFLVLAVILFSHKLKQNPHIENILWLCLSDIIVGISGVMYILSQAVDSLAYSPAFCSASIHFINAGVVQSLSQTFLVCLQRYMAVVKHTQFKQFNKKWRYGLIFGTSIFVHVYIGIIVARYLQAERILFCGAKAYPEYKSFSLAISLLSIPFLVFTVGLYASIVITFRKHIKRIQPAPGNHLVIHVSEVSRNVSTNTSHEQKKASQKKEMHLIVTVGLILAAMLFMTGPNVFIRSIEGISTITFERKTKTVLSILAAINSILNPILYACRITEFRRELCRMCRLCS